MTPRKMMSSHIGDRIMTLPDWIRQLGESCPTDRSPIAVRMPSATLGRLYEWRASAGPSTERRDRFNGIPITIDESADPPVWVMPDDGVMESVELARAMIERPDDAAVRERYREVMGSPDSWPDGVLGPVLNGSDPPT